MNKRLILVFILIVIVIVILAVWLALVFVRPNESGPSAYSAVYLSTGDIYFGKLSWLPWPKMKEVWYLQRGVDQQNQPQLGVARFKNAFWGPIDEIYLNPKEIIFWTSLRKDSQLTKAFANPASLESAVPPQQVPEGNPPVATSTAR
ncbi:MAG: hypothetical protein AAB686_02380 [Patescibacteria group bacterium]